MKLFEPETGAVAVWFIGALGDVAAVVPGVIVAFGIVAFGVVVVAPPGVVIIGAGVETAGAFVVRVLLGGV